ncbi:MAG: histidinol dehydrogenase [Gaiella sp.]
MPTLRRGSLVDDALATVAPIVADVRDRGDAALFAWTERLDGPRPDGIAVPPAAIASAVIAEDALAALRQMIEAVRRFSRANGPADTSVEAAPGIVSERRWLPVDAVGVCVPSGTAPLPSSLVMTCVPAFEAGVRRVVVVTPRPDPAILVAAREVGVREMYAVGGAQAVAALAYGTETIAPVDVIVGPGNAYVTAAKLLVSTRVRIDLPAGPSEVVVIADGTADASPVAASLLAQAEHGPASDAVLFSTEATLSAAVSTLVRGYDNVRVETVATVEEALARAEEYAPEHLELQVGDPETLAARVRNAGSVFIGGSAAIGDYAAGATHVLPTGGLARSTGGLGVETFMKPTQIVRVSPQGALRAAGVVGPLARLEGLPLHAAAVEAYTGAEVAR